MSFNALGTVLNTYAGQREILNIRLKLLRHLQGLSGDYHANTSTGDLLFRLEKDVEQAMNLATSIIVSLFQTALMVILTIAVMLLLNLRLTLLILPLVPCFLLIKRYAFSRLQKLSDAVQNRSGSRFDFLQEHLSALVQVQLLCRELTQARRYVRLERSVIDVTVKRRSAEMLLGFFTILVNVLAMSMVLGYGGYQVLLGTLTIGGLVAFYNFLTNIFQPLEGLVNVYTQFQSASASIRRIQQVLEAEPAVRNRREGIKLRRDTPGRIALNDVFFSYHSGQQILEHFDLHIAPGERIALVGASGSGKSTIARLLTRLYEAERGRIALDGHDIKDLDITNLRSIVALVPQDAVLFNITLRENLLYGNPAASKAELIEAANLAQIQPIIDKLPKGWNEPIGARGVKLSGGERQRLALARAILQRPRVLILDESTSALDGPTERMFLDALGNAFRQVTTIIIAHRLSAIRWADRIVVLDRGRIVEDGSHYELYKRNGIYRNLCNEQMTKDANRHLNDEALLNLKQDVAAR